MATESIGSLIPTAIPGYADAADIQAALRAYHYGSYTYDTANTSASNLVSPSIAKTIYDIQTNITTLNNRPASGGDVATTAPVAGDFTPSGIPNGYVWVDQDGSLGGSPVSATSIFTNSAPTTSLTTGLIWVDKDSVAITANPYIPVNTIDAKGDLLVGSANDSITVLPASTNGYLLSVNSATTSGLQWVAPSTADITSVTAGTGLTGGGTSGDVTVSLDTSSVYVLPSQTGSNGKYLSTNGSSASWATVDFSATADVVMTLMGAY